MPHSFSLLCFFCFAFVFSSGASTGVISDANPDNNPHLPQIAKVVGNSAMFRISGVLQPNDTQYVHDIYCGDGQEKIGTVKMRWGFKYGSRYGGGGVIAEGRVSCEWNGDNGWVKICLPPDAHCGVVTVRPRLEEIPKN